MVSFLKEIAYIRQPMKEIGGFSMFLPILLRVEACLSGEMAAKYVYLQEHVATFPAIADNDHCQTK